MLILVIASPETPALLDDWKSTIDVYYVRLCYSRTARLLSCRVHVGHHTSDLRHILPIRRLCVGCWRVCGRKMKDESERERDCVTA